MKPAEYWRKQALWSKHLLKTGTVVQSTLLRVVPGAQSEYAPYSFLIVQVEDNTLEVMGVPGETFESGDQVRLVLRRIAASSDAEPIAYGIKAEKVIANVKK